MNATNDPQPSRSIPPDIPTAQLRSPVNVQPLEYQPRTGMEPVGGIPTGLQFFFGMLSPFVYGFAVSILLTILSDAHMGSLVPPLCFLAFAAFFVIITMVRIKLHWKGFIPGALTIILGLPLLAIGTLLVICGTGGMKL